MIGAAVATACHHQTTGVEVPSAVPSDRVEDLRLVRESAPLVSPNNIEKKIKRTRGSARHGARRQRRSRNKSYEAEFPQLPEAGQERRHAGLEVARRAAQPPLYETPLVLAVARQDNGFVFMRQVPEKLKCIDMSHSKQRRAAATAAIAALRRRASDAATVRIVVPVSRSAVAGRPAPLAARKQTRKERRLHQGACRVVRNMLDSLRNTASPAATPVAPRRAENRVRPVRRGVRVAGPLARRACARFAAIKQQQQQSFSLKFPCSAQPGRKALPPIVAPQDHGGDIVLAPGGRILLTAVAA